MSRRSSKPSGKHASRPRKERDRHRRSDGFEAWVPHLVLQALGRRVGPVFRFTESELYALARSVRTLSRGFTRSRELAGASYFQDPQSLAAYLLFFWPVSYEQARVLFRSFIPAPGLSGASVLDLGGGPGPAACAALDCGAKRMVIADAERPALDMAGDLVRSRGRTVDPWVWDAEKGGRLPGGKYDYIVFSHLLNELWTERKNPAEVRADLVEELSGLLHDGGRIIIIEPALLATSRDLLRVRNLLRARGFPVLSPCLRQDDCPCVMSGSDANATCHADIPWRPPAWYVRLAHRARIGKESLRFSFLILGKRDGSIPAGEDSVFRVVSERMLSKSGRMRYLICNERGRFSLSARPEGKERWTKTFLGLRRYDKIRIASTEQRENGLGLIPESHLHILRET